MDPVIQQHANASRFMNQVYLNMLSATAQHSLGLNFTPVVGDLETITERARENGWII